MEFIRVLRKDGKNVICDEPKHSEIQSEGNILNEETWTRFCNNLPSPQSKRFKGVFLAAHMNDLGFSKPVDACNMLEYSFDEAKRWLGKMNGFVPAGR